MSIKGLLLLSLGLACLQSAASERPLQNIQCELRNFFGLRVGSVVMTPKESLQITSGFISGVLQVDESNSKEIIAIDPSVTYSYIFSYHEPLSKKQQTMDGILYQQKLKELPGSRLAVAQFNCDVVLK
jgi:hypothetical protein